MVMLSLRAPDAAVAVRRPKQCNVRAQLWAAPMRQQRQQLHQSRKQRVALTRATAPNIVEVDAARLEVEIMDRDRPLIIDFYATWCGPCLLLAKELETVATLLGDRVRILKVDTDANPDISTQLQIQGLPTLIFVGMNKDRPALRTEGLLPAAAIQEIVEQELEAPPAPAAPAN